MCTSDPPIAPMYAVVDAAKRFGLTDHEVLQVVDECFSSADDDSTVGECMEELVSALARRILRTLAKSRA
jgi:hypothetical protein